MTRAILGYLGRPEGAAAVAEVAGRLGLRSVGLAPSLAVHVGTDMPVRRLADGGLILGDIFPRSGAACRSASDGWGNYLAFSSCARGFAVERAPLTGMPLYWIERDGGVLLASDLALLDCLLPARQVDWTFIAGTLVFINLRAERTGVAALTELLPGTRLLFDGYSAVAGPTWSPWPSVAAASPLSAAELASELERRIVECVAAWSASRGDIVLELSGGLDSSIVAAALTAAGARYSAITFATPGADGDERSYARAVAERCGVRLAEVIHDDSAIDLVSLPAIVQPRPAAYGVLGGIDQAFDAAVPRGHRAVFGGIGGDNVFDFDGTVAPILDAFGHFGVSRRAFSTLRDIARASGATVWEAGRLALAAQRKGPRRGWRRDTQYLNAGTLPERQPPHPWDEGAGAASRAKRNHVESIRRILDFLDRPARWHGRDVVAPLLSQPVVELSLSIPSWTWFAGGRDRVVARTAFEKHLPPEIVWRRGKGRLESLCAAAYLRQRPGLRELLLGGRLAARGLLDLPAIEAYLDRDLKEGDFDYFRLIEIADVERWLRAFEAGPVAGANSAHRAYCADLAGSGSTSPLSQ